MSVLLAKSSSVAASFRPTAANAILCFAVSSHHQGEKMAIGNAVQRGSYVYVYDEKGRQLYGKPAGSGPDDGLKGYTSGTVNIRRGSYIYTYDEKGVQRGSTPAR
ncbi:hypothetical protein [Pandoraea thiooxydans]|uniref:hypothetical protein n=1 Tax=Pandoraea thiooxydans TaxID=445709 RepID=UPI001F1BCA34|nr:hypothetical protein [Pandoraea thiooxydans]